MLTRQQQLQARRQAGEMIGRAGIHVTDQETDGIEVVDFGLSQLQKEGVQVLTLVQTERISVKVLALFPNQTEPEHWHPPVAGDPGKEETVRVISGTLYFFIPGENTCKEGFLVKGSTGGLTTLTLEQRCVALNDKRTEVASLNMGSVNFGENVYINRLPDIRYWAKRMRQTKTVPEMEIFDSGMLPAARALVAEGAIQPPYSICFALGFPWTLAPDPKSLFFITSMMSETVPWGVIHDGMTDFTLLATAIGLGASLVRVGFEDSIFWTPDQAVKRNVELVQKLAQLVRLLGHAVATPAEARAILGIRRI